MKSVASKKTFAKAVGSNDAFEFCRATCRTSSKSTVHGNEYTPPHPISGHSKLDTLGLCYQSPASPPNPPSAATSGNEYKPRPTLSTQGCMGGGNQTLICNGFSGNPVPSLSKVVKPAQTAPRTPSARLFSVGLYYESAAPPRNLRSTSTSIPPPLNSRPILSKTIPKLAR